MDITIGDGKYNTSGIKVQNGFDFDEFKKALETDNSLKVKTTAANAGNGTPAKIEIK